MAKIDQFIAPGDLDLGRVTLTLVPGSHFFQDTYTYQVSSKSENGKGVKIAEHRTPSRPAWTIYISAGAADKNTPYILTCIKISPSEEGGHFKFPPPGRGGGILNFPGRSDKISGPRP